MTICGSYTQKATRHVGVIKQKMLHNYLRMTKLYVHLRLKEELSNKKGMRYTRV